MSDEKVLQEIALNKRKVKHSRWGSFYIKRPTNRVLAELDTIRTRSINHDLQQKDVVTDPITGKQKLVPAFLTSRKKMEIMTEIGEWTEEDAEAMAQADAAYRKACIELDQAGFNSVRDLVLSANDLRNEIADLMGDKKEQIQEELSILFPAAEADPGDLNTMVEPPVGYAEARKKIQNVAKSTEVTNLLDLVDRLHKQYTLLIEGIKAQSEVYVLHYKELMLVADTVESRADNKVSLGKLVYCVTDENDKPLWSSIDECQDNDPEFLGWLTTEMGLFERLDPSSTEEERERVSRFNFLFPTLASTEPSEGLPDQQKPKEDGEPAENEQTSSTPPSA